MNPDTEPILSSEVYILNHRNSSSYGIEREFPEVLDSNKNGGEQISMTNEEWTKFCDKIDASLRRTNLLKKVIWYSGMTTLLLGFVFLIMIMTGARVLTTNNIWYSMSILIVLTVVASFILCYDFWAVRAIEERALDTVRGLCESEALKLNMERGTDGTVVSISLHESKGNMFIFIAIGSMDLFPIGENVAVATLEEEFESSTISDDDDDIENQIATTGALHREPYVSAAPMPPHRPSTGPVLAHAYTIPPPVDTTTTAGTPE